MVEGGEGAGLPWRQGPPRRIPLFLSSEVRADQALCRTSLTYADALARWPFGSVDRLPTPPPSPQTITLTLHVTEFREQIRKIV